MAADLTRTPADEIDWQAIHTGLIARFPDSEIGSYSSGKGGTMYYIDARAVYDRLDAVVGPGNWSTRNRIIDQATACVEVTLTIHGVERADMGYPNTPVGALDKAGKLIDDEPFKAAVSDGVKRAAVQWGIGRFLYSLGTPGNPVPGKSESASSRPTASPHKLASANQLATIAKLSRLLGTPEDGFDGMTSAEASERIEELAQEYQKRLPERTKTANQEPRRADPANLDAARQRKEQGKTAPESGVKAELKTSLNHYCDITGNSLQQAMDAAATAVDAPTDTSTWAPEHAENVIAWLKREAEQERSKRALAARQTAQTTPAEEEVETW